MIAFVCDHQYASKVASFQVTQMLLDYSSSIQAFEYTWRITVFLKYRRHSSH